MDSWITSHPNSNLILLLSVVFLFFSTVIGQNAIPGDTDQDYTPQIGPTNSDLFETTGCESNFDDLWYHLAISGGGSLNNMCINLHR